MRNLWVAAALLATALVTHASVIKHADLAQDPQDQITSVTEAIEQGVADLRDNNVEAASTAINNAIQSPVFAKLPQNEQYRALLLAGMMAFDKRDYGKAHVLLKRATGIDQTSQRAWYVRLESAVNVQDYEDSARCITAIAQKWPDILHQIDPGVVFEIETYLRETNSKIERDYLQALFDTDFDDHLGGTNALWRDLALLWLREGNAQKAVLVSQRITSARTKLSMLVDKRFDAITQKNTQAYDIDRAVEKELADDRAQVSAAPDQLKPLLTLQELLLGTHHYDEALAVADKVIAKTADGKGSTTYKDFDEIYVWVLDARARSLERLGRWDDAANQWEHAARRPEHGEMNVSQIINLASFYANLQRPKEALDTLSELGNMSPYGRMQFEMVKLKVAIGQRDQAAISEHLAYMREHRADAISTWQNALLLSGDLNAAGDLLVERLANEKWRSDALVDMQNYADVAMPPMAAELERQSEKVIAEPKVQKALAKVGRIEHFNLDPP